MAKTVVGMFRDRTDAQNALEALVERGFPRDQISMVASDTAGEYHRNGDGSVAEDRPSGVGAAVGATTGAVAGGVGGYLLGLGLFAIPGLGPLVAMGPLVAALAGAGAGAVAGGLLGALVDMGVPHEEAEIYAEGVRRGYIVVTLQTDDDNADTAAQVMRAQGAIDVKEREAAWRESGWTGYNPQARPYNTEEVAREREQYGRTPVSAGAVSDRAAQQTVAERPTGTPSATPQGHGDFSDYEDGFRRDFETTLSNRGRAFDDHVPGYRYGYILAIDPRCSNMSWDEVEPEARSYWEERNPGTWEHFVRHIRYAWVTVRGRE